MSPAALHSAWNSSVEDTWEDDAAARKVMLPALPPSENWTTPALGRLSAKSCAAEPEPHARVPSESRWARLLVSPCTRTPMALSPAAAASTLTDGAAGAEVRLRTARIALVPSPTAKVDRPGTVGPLTIVNDEVRLRMVTAEPPVLMDTPAGCGEMIVVCGLLPSSEMS